MTVAAFQMPDALPTVFMVFLGLCGLTWLFTASGNDNTAMLPGRREPGKPWYSGLAISGESLSAVTLLSIVGLIALTGFDGMMLSLGCVMGLALLALVLAEPLRRAGGHTVGDALSTHFPQRSVRLGVGIATLAVCLPYVVLQLTAIGSLTAFVLGGFTGVASKAACTIVIGVLMVSLAVSGGMRGTAWMQIVKVVVLVVVMGAVAVAVLRHLHGSPFRLLSEAAAHSGLGERYLGPGVQYGSGGWAVADRGGQFVALALGVCCLPQVTMRVLTAPAGRATRTAMHWAVGQLLLVSALVVVAGIGAAAVLGGDALRAVDPSGGSALLLLADRLDPGGTLLSVVFCVVFLTALTTVADVTLAAATTVARDLLPRAAGPDGAPHRHLERRARAAAATIGLLTVAAAVQATGWNLLVLSTLGMTLAASALAPVLFYGLLWDRFTARGALWSLYGTTALTVLLLAGSPLLSGDASSAFPGHDFQWIQLTNPGLITVPAGFLLGWLGSRTDPRADSASRRRALVTSAVGDAPTLPDSPFSSEGSITFHHR